MKLLVLGGTAFLGRHVVAEALADGHEVTSFTRGRTNPWLFPEAEHRTFPSASSSSSTRADGEQRPTLTRAGEAELLGRHAGRR